MDSSLRSINLEGLNTKRNYHGTVPYVWTGHDANEMKKGTNYDATGNRKRNANNRTNGAKWLLESPFIL